MNHYSFSFHCFWFLIRQITDNSDCDVINRSKWKIYHVNETIIEIQFVNPMIFPTTFFVCYSSHSILNSQKFSDKLTRNKLCYRSPRRSAVQLYLLTPVLRLTLSASTKKFNLCFGLKTFWLPLHSRPSNTCPKGSKASFYERGSTEGHSVAVIFFKFVFGRYYFKSGPDRLIYWRRIWGVFHI